MRCPITGWLALGFAAALSGSAPAGAALQKSDACAAYQIALQGGASNAVPVVPDRLLINWREALTCLVPIVGQLKVGVTSPAFSAETRSRFLSATGAIRAIMTRLSVSDEKLKTLAADQRPRNQDTLTDFVGEFRRLDDLDVVSVLTFAGRSDNYDMRLNAVLILGNVIDNSTVCVPLIQLYDTSVKQGDPNYLNGRANLLSVISVVAPWALAENYRAIRATHDFVLEQVKKESELPGASVATTMRILSNIDLRLKTQSENTNKTANLDASDRARCRDYMKAFLPNAALSARLEY